MKRYWTEVHTDEIRADADAGLTVEQSAKKRGWHVATVQFRARSNRVSFRRDAHADGRLGPDSAKMAFALDLAKRQLAAEIAAARQEAAEGVKYIILKPMTAPPRSTP